MPSQSRKGPIKRIVQRIRALKPRTVEEARAAGFKMRKLGEGMYRRVYKVKNYDIVFKFPGATAETKTGGRKHAAQEMNRLKRLRRCEALHRFLPEIYYYDKDSGVIAMKYYPPFADFEEEADAMGRMIGTLIQKLTRVRCNDIHTENVRQNREDTVIIDLGF